MVLVSTLVIAYLRERPKISAESQRRVRIRQLFYKHEHPDKGDLTKKEERELATLVEQSPVENEDLQDTVTEEVVQALDSDSDVEYSADEEGKRASFDDISTINNGAGTN